MNWYYERAPKKAIQAGTGIRGGGKYGTTWWGQQWLNAFDGISDSNRLPRGRTYANNGSVRSIDADKNVVNAVVLGSNTYKIKIKVPLFTPAQCSNVVDMVIYRPDLLSRLLNRELPQDLLDLCNEQKVDIFPKQWSHFSAKCSCPDYAQPCKHLAAIIYLIANEIDKNPFKVFELHGFDLVGALGKAGISVAAEKQAEPMADTDLMESQTDEKTENTLAEMDWKAIDLTKFTEGSNVLNALLTDKPVFYPEGNFKDILVKAQTKVAKGVTKSANRIAELSNAPYHQVDRLEIGATMQGTFLAFSAWNVDEAVLFETKKAEELIHWLSGVPVGRLSSLSPELRAVWLCYRYAEALARNSAFVPQCLSTANNEYRVRWIPATMHENVALVHTQLTNLLPNNLLLYRGNALPMQPVKKDYLTALVSVFLNHFVVSYNDLAPLSNLVARFPKLVFCLRHRAFRQRCALTSSVGFRGYTKICNSVLAVFWPMIWGLARRYK